MKMNDDDATSIDQLVEIIKKEIPSAKNIRKFTQEELRELDLSEEKSPLVRRAAMRAKNTSFKTSK